MGSSNVEGHSEQERKRRTKIFRKFKGVFTQANRNAIPAENFSDLVNLIPIGDANLQTVPAPNVTWNAGMGSDAPYYGEYFNVNGTNYLLWFCLDGDIHAINLDNNTSQSFGGGFSAQTIRAAQWKNQYVLFATTGVNGAIYAWNGTTFSQISNAANGAPYGNISDIAVCFNRVFASIGRVLNYSGTDDFGIQGFNVNGNTPINPWAVNTAYTTNTVVVNFNNGFTYICTAPGTSAPSGIGPTGTGTGIIDNTVTWSYTGTWPWSPQNGSSFYNITDPLLRSNVQALYPANGYLYVFGITSIHVVSDLYVPTGQTLPVFNFLNVDPIVGTSFKDSIFSLGRLVLFATQYGAYQISGVQCTRMSSDIDGSWQSIDFTKTITGGAVVVNNILCAAFNIYQVNDAVAGTRNVLAMFFDSKWWFASVLDSTYTYSTHLGPIVIVIPAYYNGQPALFAATQGQTGQYFLSQVFGNTATSPPTSIKTALWELDDPLADKQGLRIGFEAQVSSLAGNFTATLDTEISSTTVTNISTVGGAVTWTNNSAQPVQWINNSSAPVTWFTTSYLFYNGAAPSGYGKYLGCTITPTATGGGSNWGSVYRLSQIMVDYALGARWR